MPPRYNIAPTQPVPAILFDATRSMRQFKPLYWGLIPSWAKDTKMGARLINARAETVGEKPSFRNAFRQRRCLIVVDGFYEWQTLKRGKQPFYYRLENGQPFAFAGLWEHWESSEGDTIDSCTILTTEANELMRAVHDRMPVILEPQTYDRWLDPSVRTSEPLQPLLRPFDATAMTSYAVSPVMNSPRHDHPDCIQPLETTVPE